MSDDTILSNGSGGARPPREHGILQLWAPTGPVQRYVPVAPELVLGREAPAVALRDPRVSRAHCRVRCDGALWTLEDLGSRNGTYLDGVRLRGACCPEAGQVLRVGHCVFLLGEGLAAQAEAVELAADGRIAGARLHAALRAIAGRAASGEALALTCPDGAGARLAVACFGAGQALRRTPADLDPGAPGAALLAAADAAAGGTLVIADADELDDEAQRVLFGLLARDGLRLCVITRRPLRDALAAGQLREDLFFRLDAVRVELPALAERREELPFHLQRTLAGMGLRPDITLVERCLRLSWPGNLRELLAELRAAGEAARAAGRDEVRAGDLDPRAGRTLKPGKREAVTRIVSAARLGDHAAVAAALRAEAGNVQASARALGVHRNQLRRWLSTHKQPDV